MHLVSKEVCGGEVSFQRKGLNILQMANGGTRSDQTKAHRPAHYWTPKGGVWRRGPQGIWKGQGCPDLNGGTWRGPEREQRDVESSGTLMEELGGDQSLKERSEGVKEGKRCGLESSGVQTEGSGGDRVPQLVLAAWLDSDFRCTGQNSHNISQSCFRFVDFFPYIILSSAVTLIFIYINIL